MPQCVFRSTRGVIQARAEEALPRKRADGYIIAAFDPPETTLNDDLELPPRAGSAAGEASAGPVVVPHAELTSEILRAVVESFVLREGTDYGEQEFSLDQKVNKVLRQLEQGEARILFDPETESVAIVLITAATRRVR
jgi:uncharacterized protein YheU (UPF0270 family)